MVDHRDLPRRDALDQPLGPRVDASEAALAASAAAAAAGAGLGFDRNVDASLVLRPVGLTSADGRFGGRSR